MSVHEVAIKIKVMMGQKQSNRLVKRVIEDWGCYFERMEIANPVEEFNGIMRARIKSGSISIRSPIEILRPNSLRKDR